MLSATFYFLLALAILIAFHEFGHFYVARLCNVKVLRFSLGFGKVLFSFKDKKGTQFALSLIPLGGYVKMLDENEGKVKPEEKHMAFNRKSVFQRIAIVSAGPLFNFIFAFIALFLMLLIGIKSVAPIVEQVTPGSVFATIGVKNNSEIIAFDQKEINSWRDFQFALMPFIGKDQGVIRLGFKNLEDNTIYKVDLPLKDLKLDEVRPDLLNSLGATAHIPRIKPEIGSVMQNSVADKAGLQPGDIIKKVDNQKIEDWITLARYIKAHPDSTLLVEFSRNNQIHKIQITTSSTQEKGKRVGVLGIGSNKLSIPKNYIRIDKENPLGALKIAFKETVRLTNATFGLIARLITGKVSVKSLSGPVGIAQGADSSAKGGISYYLLFLAIVSISLGVLNLLPVPVLDGGHLLYYLIEIVLGRPLSFKFQMIGTYLGLALLLMIMGIAISNDLFRLFG